jgi:hypothetical protein
MLIASIIALCSNIVVILIMGKGLGNAVGGHM